MIWFSILVVPVSWRISRAVQQGDIVGYGFAAERRLTVHTAATSASTSRAAVTAMRLSSLESDQSTLSQSFLLCQRDREDPAAKQLKPRKAVRITTSESGVGR
jgi:hypothetical protein